MKEFKLVDPSEALEREHPKHRASEADDPMEMVGERADGNPLAMLEGIVEEYARMGWGPDRIHQLFNSPFFQGTFGLKNLLGEKEIERCIEATVKRCGVFNFRSGTLDLYGE